VSKSKSKSKPKKKRKPKPSKFEDMLLVIERHERPADYPGLTGETRRAASNAQFIAFYERYWPDWRHTKLRMYRRLLDDRNAVLEAERSRLEKAELHAETVIYGQFTGGLLAAAASEFCQYAEDLAMLVRACASDGFFARDLAEAQAGKMQAKAKSWESIDEAAATLQLRIPAFGNAETWRDTDIGKDYLEAIARSRDRLHVVGRLYRAWEPIFMRYKHGLQLALVEPGRTIETLVEGAGLPMQLPHAFYCGAASPEERDSPMFMLPTFGDDDVRLNAAHLARERNLLRLVDVTNMSADIKLFEGAKAFVSQLQRALLENKATEIQGRPGRPFYVPAEDPAALIAFYREPPSGDDASVV